MSSTTTVWTAFLEKSGTRADRDAIVMGDRCTSFAILHDLSLAYAERLQRQGIFPGDRVIIWMDASAECAAAILGTWICGAIIVLMSPSADRWNLMYGISKVEASLLICLSDSRPPGDLPISIVDEIDINDTSSDSVTEIRTLPTDPASILFTSGSTGKPKAVTQSHGSLLRACRAVAAYLGLSEDDRILCPIPWHLDYGFGQLLSTLIVGTTHILPTAPNPFQICASIEAHRPTFFPGIPSLFSYLFQGISPIRKTELASIRVVTNTGGSLPGPVLADLLEVFSDARIYLNYGLTETYRTSFLDPSLVKERPTSIGTPIPGVDVVLVKDDGGLAGPDEEGQIVHRGDYIMMGYWNDEEATSAALRPDPISPGGCLSKRSALFTGDYGHIDQDGFLYFHGRKDHQFKSMGVRVNPNQIEEIIHQSGMIRQVGVFRKKNEILENEIWAAVVLNNSENQETVLTKLKSYAREAMSRYMVPRRFILKDSLPMTNSGKIDYVALQREADGDPSAFSSTEPC